MSELINPNSAIARQIVALLSHYGFDLRGYTPNELAVQWLKIYHEHWVRLAIIEALYQGRYKSISIEQILNFWARRQHPIFHFNHDFERLICRKLPRHLTDLSQDADEEVTASINRSWLNSTVSSHLTQPSTTPVNSEIIDPWRDTSVSYLDLALQSNDTLPEPPAMNTDSFVEDEEVEVEESTLEADAAFSDGEEDQQESIHSFTPPPDGSGCYRKLKAVAHQSITSQETA